MKHKLLQWLAYQLKVLPRDFDAYLAPTARISPEGQIENIRGGKEWIRVGERSFLRGRLLTYGHGGEISIGDWCYLGVRSEIWSMNKVTIGNRVLISHDVNINDGSGHSINPQERHEHFKKIILKGHPRTESELHGLKSAQIVIEDDVWISFGVIILPGVTIGARSVIAAGSIVTKDIPPDTLYRCEVKPILSALSE
jgi:acetyltransferase-like isoleucine patch superfamily enzyme